MATAGDHTGFVCDHVLAPPYSFSSNRTSTAACLTTDALKEHDQNTRPVSPFALLNMAPEQRIGGLSDTPILPPSSTRSSRRSRSSSPSRPSDAQYRRGALRRANICVDEEIPMDIRRYTDSRVFHIPNKDNDLYKCITLGLCTIPRTRNQSHPILSGNPTPEDTRSPSPHSVHAAEAAIPVFKLKDPRPDIWPWEPRMGRAVARSFLFDLQDTSRLISGPPYHPLGSSAGATGGNLYQAQNQAAVGAAQPHSRSSAICRVFKMPEDWTTKAREILKTGLLGQPKGLTPIYTLPFRFTTEGPIPELWLHFPRFREEDFCMVCLGTWRTTLKDGSLGTFCAISRQC
ncbi:hypothetical protein BO99DRAFT_484853 [Aspergillus violaceofuscus CBS 115571]|uniref:Uncharacterized protein n=1 Tax=Aspergillus violaceofuscus (strain CBS 115571) TaxID=1450538 RepID=A0A2V5GZZ0_ASPV1|nr:hypothetical protein BO99DRAFT_484853 [Aspergillus violaceofuscus CBS 115571]